MRRATMKDDPANRLWSEIEEIRKGESDLGAKVASLETSVAAVGQSLNRIEARLNAPRESTNWVGIGSLLIALVVAAGTYVQARLGPLEKDLSRLDAVAERCITHLIEDARSEGRTRAELAAQEQRWRWTSEKE